MLCKISISPSEGTEDNGFSEPPRLRIESEPPEGTHHNEHPAFDREIEQDIRHAFESEVPIGEQLQFLENYEYPYQYPTVATVEWYPDKNIQELCETMEFSEDFLNNL